LTFSPDLLLIKTGVGSLAGPSKKTEEEFDSSETGVGVSKKRHE
jgi:hypothetical protein